jgi:hypothetical protein
MSRRSLTTYLDDHLAGSVAALELLDHLLALHSGAEREPFTELRTEIQEDQQVVRELLEQLGEKESSVRKAAAWLSEKLCFQRLPQRAADQFERVDELRLRCAQVALAVEPDGR